MASMNVEFCERLVATLAHSLWQGLLIGVIFAVATALWRSRGPAVRHAIGLFCLLALVLCLPLTLVLTAPRQLQKAQVIESPSTKSHTVDGMSQSDQRLKTDAASVSIQTADLANKNRSMASAYTRWQQWAPWLSAFYLLGVLLGLARLGRGVWVCHILRRAAEPMSDPEWLRRIDVVRARIGLCVSPAVFWCRTSVVPTVVGIARPVILLPMALMTGLNAEQMEQILCHEMMHVRRRDALVNLIISLAEALLFFHPIIWTISRRMRLDRELCCDVASASSIDERWRYAQLLVQLAERARHPSLAPTQLAIVSDPSQLRVRVETLLRRPSTRKCIAELRSFVLLSIGVLGLISLASRTVPAAPPAKVLPAKNSPVSPLDRIRKQQELDAKELQEQDEQLELSKDWPLKFPSDVQENELAGVIVDSDGRPIAGALVDFYPAFTGHETTTDDQGMFRYRFKDAGRNDTYEVRFSKEGFSPIYRRKQPLGVQDFRVVLNSNTYLEGQVVDQKGEPVPKARVIANHEYFAGGGFNRETRTMTDGNGHYRLYLSPETYTVAVISDRDEIERQNDVEVLKDQGQKLDLQLHSGVLFKAKVLDAHTKEPVSGVVLYHRTEAWMHGKSNAEGDLVIAHCLPGEENLQVGFGDARLTHGYIEYDTKPFGAWWSPEAMKEWHRTKTTEVALTFDLTVDMPPVTLYVEAGVSISGKVVDPDGNPVAKATVADARTGTGNSLTGDTRYSVETKDDGTYQIYLPPSGDEEYNLIAHDGSYLTWRKFAAGVTEPMQTKAGQQIKNLEIQLQRAATVRGRVTVPDGEKLGGWDVRAHARDKRGNRYYDPTTKTKDDGSFEINFIRPGVHFIQVEPMWMKAEEGPRASFDIVEVEEGDTIEGVELQYVGGKK